MGDSHSVRMEEVKEKKNTSLNLQQAILAQKKEYFLNISRCGLSCLMIVSSGMSPHE